MGFILLSVYYRDKILSRGMLWISLKEWVLGLLKPFMGRKSEGKMAWLNLFREQIIVRI